MIDKIVIWLIKRLIFFWDRHGDKAALVFGRDDRTDYSVLVSRYFEDCWTNGTAVFPYNAPAKEVAV